MAFRTDFKDLLAGPQYSFLREDPRLKGRVILLGLSGSYGYGTNREGSDLDLRGAALNLPSDLIGLTSFEQFEDRETDTVIYSFMKLIRLLLGCNPNTIEILGLDPGQYLILTETGRELIRDSHLFLSKRAAASFGHYADAQLRRLQNAIARDSLSQTEREKHMLKSVRHALEDFNRDYENDSLNAARLYVDRAVTEGLEEEIFLTASFDAYPLRQYNALMNTLNSVVRDYNKLGKRNHKKDERHLNKHSMHLIRLFMMGIDILKKEEIRTHRPAEDLKLLTAIRDGAYMKDGVMTREFYEVLEDYEKRFEEAEKNSRLPDGPDMAQIEVFVERVNRKALMEEFV